MMQPVSDAAEVLHEIEDMANRLDAVEWSDLTQAEVRVEDEDGTIDVKVIGMENVNGRLVLVVESLPDHLFEREPLTFRQWLRDRWGR